MKLSAEERATGRLQPDRYASALEQIRTNGYVVLEQALAAATLERVRTSFEPLFADYIARKGYNTGTNRAQMHLPFAAPFIDEAVIAHPLVIPIVDKLLGSDCRCVYLASDTPMPGSDYQRVHSDNDPLFADLSVALPAYCLVVNIPLVDTTEENGPLEVWPGTHLLPDRENHNAIYDTVNPHIDINRAALEMTAVRVLMPAGSIVIRDVRMWHRGTPNRTNAARTNVALIYSRSWFGYGSRIAIPQMTYDGLSAKARQLFRYEKIGQPAMMPWEWSK
ncbi:MAG: phytanoyl-CoA dioxygenase family protein [Paenibacillaceae bacterium]|nr:phytanoyl-CoA dioxygenase family protein [Paenibacillaceae bacterium]